MAGVGKTWCMRSRSDIEGIGGGGQWEEQEQEEDSTFNGRHVLDCPTLSSSKLCMIIK